MRFTLQEGEHRPGFVGDLASRVGGSPTEACELLEKASMRVGRELGLKNPLQLHGSTLHPVDCAGLIRLAPGIELEVVPKFLRPKIATWREDFFLIATLSKLGRIFPVDMVHAGPTGHSDLASLVGQAMLLLFWDVYRQPLRVYRTTTVHDFAYEGEVEPEDILLPEAAGFRQSIVLFDRSNQYNAIILQAARSLIPEVRDSQTRMELVRMVELLTPQAAWDARRTPKRVPSRHRAWQPLYDLARHVLNGFGAGYDSSGLYGPGFVLKTWHAWQDLMALATRLGLRDLDVLTQQKYRLGSRKRDRKRALNVYPDIALRDKDTGEVVLIIDAKYKTKLSRGQPRVAEADIYEAIAFMQASGCPRTVLLYPRLAGRARRQCGHCERFETVRVQPYEIEALEVECQGIAREGLGSFSLTFANEIRDYLLSGRPDRQLVS